MNTLDAPVFEVKKDSDWYKETKQYNERRKNFFEEMNKTYMKDSGFVYWHSEYFGILGSSADYETYKDELKKNPVEDRIYIFKKRSKHYPIFKEMIKQIGDRDPFKSHDVLGMNNMTGNQWIGDRWFYGVKNEECVTGEEVEPIDYKEYLKVVVEALADE